MEHDRLRVLRLVTLISLMLSDGTYTVLRRYSRGILRETYSVTEVLLVSEIIKLLFSTWMIARNRTASRVTDSSGIAKREAAGVTTGEYAASPQLSAHLYHLLLQSRKMLVLAATYGLGNSLSYYALARVGAGTFVVIANLKTLTTAGFSRLMLARSYSWTRWRALILLVCGVVLFVLPTLEEDSNRRASTESDANSLADRTSVVRSEVILGCLAVLVVVALSGFGSIYLEAAIKNDPLDIWERNFQLGLYSILMYLLMIVMSDNPTDGGARFFANWTPLAVALSFLGAAGGLLVALSIKYGDSVLKTLAISGGIIYASVVDHAVLDGPLNAQMSISAIIVIIAIINYTFDSTPADDEASASIVTERSDEEDRSTGTGNRTESKDGWNENEEPWSLLSRRL